MARRVLSGGENLTKRLGEIASQLGRGGVVNVGFLEGGVYPGTGTPVALVAAIQEFGAPGASIPPRPFFRNMIAAKSPEWPDRVAAAVTTFDYDVAKILDFMGQDIQADLRQSIIDTNEPPLSQITLMLRKMRSEGGPNFVVTAATVGEAARRVAAGESVGDASTKPLVDTGYLLSRVDYEVETR